MAFLEPDPAAARDDRRLAEIHRTLAARVILDPRPGAATVATPIFETVKWTWPASESSLCPHM